MTRLTHFAILIATCVLGIVLYPHVPQYYGDICKLNLPFMGCSVFDTIPAPTQNLSQIQHDVASLTILSSLELMDALDALKDMHVLIQHAELKPNCIEDIHVLLHGAIRTLNETLDDMAWLESLTLTTWVYMELDIDYLISTLRESSSHQSKTFLSTTFKDTIIHMNIHLTAIERKSHAIVIGYVFNIRIYTYPCYFMLIYYFFYLKKKL
jgi:hypothetical protein